MATYAKLIDFLASTNTDTSGDPLSGYVVASYEEDGATAKAVWEDRDKTLPTSAGKSQFTLDANGKAVVYGSGTYVFKIFLPGSTPGVDSPQFTTETSTDVDVVSVSIVDTVTDLKTFDGSTGASATVGGYSSRGDGGHGLFLWDGSDLSTEVASDTQNGVYVPPNSDVTGASGAWVRQYSGAVNVLWFGSNTNPGTTDMTSAFSIALNIYGSVYVPKGIYLVGDIDVNLERFGSNSFKSLNIIGEDEPNTILKAKAGALHIIKLTTSIGTTPLPIPITIERITLSGENTCPDGLIIDNIARFKVNDLKAKEFTDAAIELRGTLVAYFENLEIFNVSTGIRATKLNSIYANALVVSKSTISNCSSLAIDFDYGLLLKVSDVDFEVNGTNADTSTGAIHVGANTSEEISASSISVIIENSWFEANLGNVINVLSGRPVIKSNIFLNLSSDKDINFGASVTDFAIEDCSLPNANGHIDTSLALYGQIRNTFATTMSLNSNVTASGAFNGYRTGFTSDLEIANEKNLVLSRANGAIKHTMRADPATNHLIISPNTGTETRLNSNLRINSHAWNGNLLRLENYYLWVDATGDLRIKNGAPTSDLDGVVVGTQS